MSQTTVARKPRPVRRCFGCESVIGVYSDGLCGTCYDSGLYEWCNVCNEYQYTQGDECRHISWTECGYIGAGVHKGDWDQSRGDFHAMLDLFAAVEKPCLDDYPDLVTAIECEVAKNAFWTRLEGFMLSTPTLYLYRLRPDLPHLEPGVGLFFARVEASQLGERDSDHDVATGFGWLQSLEDGKTLAANRRTVEWIRLWRANRRLEILQ